MDLSTICVYGSAGRSAGSSHLDSVQKVAANGLAGKSTESVHANWNTKQLLLLF